MGGPEIITLKQAEENMVKHVVLRILKSVDRFMGITIDQEKT